MAQRGVLNEGTGPASSIGYLTLLSNAKPLQNLPLRRALSFSLDRNQISTRVSYGLRRPLRSLVPPSIQAVINLFGRNTIPKQLVSCSAVKGIATEPPSQFR